MAVGAAIPLGLGHHVGQHKEPDDGRHEHGGQGVDEPAVADGAAEHADAHQEAEPGDGDEEVAALEAADGGVGALVGGLDGVHVLELARDVGLGEVLAVKAGARDGAGEDDVDGDGVVGVEVQLLGQGVGEAAQGDLGGHVGRVAGDGAEGGDGARHDEALRGARARGVGGQPEAEGGVGELGGAVKVDVHVAAQVGKGRLGEEAGRRQAGDAPDNVGRDAVVPGRRVGEQGRRKVGHADVGRDGVEALGRGVLGGGAEVGQQGLEALDIAGDGDDVGAAGGELDGDAAAHALGRAGEEDGLGPCQRCFDIWRCLEVHEGKKASRTLPSTGMWFFRLKRPMAEARRTANRAEPMIQTMLPTSGMASAFVGDDRESLMSSGGGWQGRIG
ncbi:hypothetical protein VDGD_20563 [Verticillium dahliae]|nr:hypothetical protein VDGD_20563 [Verticillium dahliae]